MEKTTKDKFEKLIARDIDWLGVVLQHSTNPIKAHILGVLEHSVEAFYPKPALKIVDNNSSEVEDEVEVEVVEKKENPKKVIRLGGLTKLDLPVDVVLEAARGELTGVVLTGWDKDGEQYNATTFADGGVVLWLLEKCKKALLSEHFED